MNIRTFRYGLPVLFNLRHATDRYYRHRHETEVTRVGSFACFRPMAREWNDNHVKDAIVS